jgi:hypothetical protein
VSQPFLSLGVGLNERFTGGDNLSNWLSVTFVNLSVWVGNNGLVDLLVDIFASLGGVSLEALVPLGEENLIFFWVFLLDGVHVVSDVSSEDSILMDLSIILSGGLFGISGLSSLVGDNFNPRFGVTWESLNSVRNVQTSITSTLKGTEDSGTGGGSLDTNIKEGLEWSLVTFALDEEHFTIDLFGGFVIFSESNLLEESSSEEESGGIMGRVVGKTSSESHTLKFLRVSSAHNLITSHGRVDDLADDLGGSSSNDESIFLRVVLVLSWQVSLLLA